MRGEITRCVRRNAMRADGQQEQHINNQLKHAQCTLTQYTLYTAIHSESCVIACIMDELDSICRFAEKKIERSIKLILSNISRKRDIPYFFCQKPRIFSHQLTKVLK
jgi:hypothetical protein